MKENLLKFLFLFMILGLNAYSQTRTVTGVVTGKDDGMPLPGVSITITGTKTGTVTGGDGSFSIKVPAGQHSLTFSYVGYTSKTEAINASGKMNVVLDGNQKALNEVLVVGYGTQTKRESVGSISQVKGADIAQQPVQSFQQALAGKAAGVQITIPNGVMNTPPVFHIRGTNSISLSSQPLIVVDGVVSYSGDFSGGESGGNALANVNPEDIETIDILKDASATAIYGSRGANGVVVITTKRGKKGTSTVSIDSWMGATTVQRLPKVLDAFQYVALKNEALVNSGQYNANTFYTGLFNDASGNPINTDWTKLVYRTGSAYNVTASVSGGSEKTTYYGSVNYSKQQGVIKKNDYINKSMLFNIDHKANKYISYGAKLSYADQFNLAATSSGSLSGEAYSTAGLGRLAVLLPPNLGPYLNDGSYNVTSSGIGLMNNKGFTITYPNPVPSLDLDRANNEINHTTGNVYLVVTPLPWITLKSQYGVDYLYTNNDLFSNPVSNFNAQGVNTASATASYQQNKQWDWVNTAQFDQKFGKHSMTLLLGNEQQRSYTSGFGINRSQLSDLTFNQIQSGYVNVATSSMSISENYLVSFFGRLNYNFDQKYFISGTIRRDGFSGFGAGKKYGIFPGFGAGWQVSKEKFWADMGAEKVFSSFKLKASYGRVGNNGVGAYPSLNLYSLGLYNSQPTLAPSQNGNPNLGWETSTKLDMGFDYGLFDDRISGSFAYYKNDITDLLFNVPIAPSAGFASSPLVNVGSMYNQGFEFDINADIIRDGAFKWNANFNIGFNKNKITSLLPGNDSFTTSTSSLEIANITKVGSSLSDLYIVRTAGVNPANGRRIFINGKGEKVEYTFSGTQHWYYQDGTNAPAISQSADAVDYANTLPKTVGGMTNTFRYKNFDLSTTLTFQAGFYTYYGTAATLTDQRFWNNSTDILDHWTTPGQVARYPKVVFGDNVSNGTSFPTDFNVYKGDFIKVKSINLGYTLPKGLLSKLGISNVRVYVTGYNLFIFTHYPGPDPEVGSNGLTNAAQGVDRNTSANGRTITGGISVKF